MQHLVQHSRPFQILLLLVNFHMLPSASFRRHEMSSAMFKTGSPSLTNTFVFTGELSILSNKFLMENKFDRGYYMYCRNFTASE